MSAFPRRARVNRTQGGDGSAAVRIRPVRAHQPPPHTSRRDEPMRRASSLALLVTLGAAAACDVDEPTAPAREAPRPAPEVVTASLATVLGRAAVDESGDVGLFTSLVSGSDGAQRVAYYDGTNERLKYAACFSNCTSAANWQRGVIDQSARVGWFA